MEVGSPTVLENLLDLVFICDCTASMDSYIDAAKENITNIIETISASGKRHVRFGLIAFRDHPPEEDTYVTKIFPFTESVSEAKDNVSALDAQGGGDRPEAVATALAAAIQFPFRRMATKIVVLVADAPPHGLCSFHSRDGFPDGCPDGADPIIVARRMAEGGIILYTVGCEPALSNSPFAGDFYKAIAQITGGRYIPLGNAGALPQVIIGGAEEEMKLETLSEELEKEADQIRAEAREKNKLLTDEKLVKYVTRRLQSRGVQTVQLRVDDIGFTEDLTPIAARIAVCDTLQEVKEMLNQETPPSLMSGAEFGGYVSGGGCPVVPLAGFKSHEQSVEAESISSVALMLRTSPNMEVFTSQGAYVEDNAISYAQVRRVLRRTKSRSRSVLLAQSF